MINVYISSKLTEKYTNSSKELSNFMSEELIYLGDFFCVGGGGGGLSISAAWHLQCSDN